MWSNAILFFSRHIHQDLSKTTNCHAKGKWKEKINETIQGINNIFGILIQTHWREIGLILI